MAFFPFARAGLRAAVRTAVEAPGRYGAQVGGRMAANAEAKRFARPNSPEGKALEQARLAAHFRAGLSVEGQKAAKEAPGKFVRDRVASAASRGAAKGERVGNRAAVGAAAGAPVAGVGYAAHRQLSDKERAQRKAAAEASAEKRKNSTSSAVAKAEAAEDLQKAWQTQLPKVLHAMRVAQGVQDCGIGEEATVDISAVARLVSRAARMAREKVAVPAQAMPEKAAAAIAGEFEEPNGGAEGGGELEQPNGKIQGAAADGIEAPDGKVATEAPKGGADAPGEKTPRDKSAESPDDATASPDDATEASPDDATGPKKKPGLKKQARFDGADLLQKSAPLDIRAAFAQLSPAEQADLLATAEPVLEALAALDDEIAALPLHKRAGAVHRFMAEDAELKKFWGAAAGLALRAAPMVARVGSRALGTLGPKLAAMFGRGAQATLPGLAPSLAETAVGAVKGTAKAIGGHIARNRGGYGATAGWEAGRRWGGGDAPEPQQPAPQPAQRSPRQPRQPRQQAFS